MFSPPIREPLTMLTLASLSPASGCSDGPSTPVAPSPEQGARVTSGGELSGGTFWRPFHVRHCAERCAAALDEQAWEDAARAAQAGISAFLELGAAVPRLDLVAYCYEARGYALRQLGRGEEASKCCIDGLRRLGDVAEQCSPVDSATRVLAYHAAYALAQSLRDEQANLRYQAAMLRAVDLLMDQSERALLRPLAPEAQGRLQQNLLVLHSGLAEMGYAEALAQDVQAGSRHPMLAFAYRRSGEMLATLARTPVIEQARVGLDKVRAAESRPERK